MTRFPEPWGLEDRIARSGDSPEPLEDRSGTLPEDRSGEVPEGDRALCPSPPGVDSLAPPPPHATAGPLANVPPHHAPAAPAPVVARVAGGERLPFPRAGGQNPATPAPLYDLDDLPACAAADVRASDALLESWGFLGADALDARDYQLVREAKVRTLMRLNEALRDRAVAIDPPKLAQIAQRLGDAERGKVTVVAAKVGRLNERRRGGVVLRARIGVAARPESGSGGAAAAVDVTIEEP